MNKGPLAGVMLLLLLAAGGVAFWLLRGAADDGLQKGSLAPPPIGSEPGDDATDVAPPIALEIDPPSDSAPVVPPAETATLALRAEDRSGAPGRGAVTLRVLDPDQLPISGAGVAVGRSPLAPADAAWRVDEHWQHRTLTDERGVARLLLEFPGPLDEVRDAVWIHAVGFVATRLEVAVRAGSERDLGDITLAAGATIRGSVVYADGTPANGARVWTEKRGGDRSFAVASDGRVQPEHPFPYRLPAGWAPQSAARTADDGEFSLSGVGAAPMVVRVLPADGDVLVERWFNELPTDSLRIELPELLTLRGRVHGADDPAALRMQLAGGGDINGHWTVPVQDDGTFAFRGVPAMRGYLELADPADRWAASQNIAFDRDSGVFELHAEWIDHAEDGSVSVFGQVVDAATGDPIEQFALAVAATSKTDAMPAGLGWLVEHQRDAEGRFEVRDLEPGTYVVWIRSRGRAGAVRHVEVTGTPAELRVALPGDAPGVRGRVTWPDGSPVSGVTVRPVIRTWERLPVASESSPLHAPAVTAADGSFRIAFLGAHPVTLIVNGAAVGGSTLVVANVRGDDRVLEVTLPRAASLQVRLLSPDGLPAPDREVHALHLGVAGEPDRAYEATTGPDGAAFLENLQPGHYRVRVRKNERAWVSAEGTLTELGSGQEGKLTVRLPAYGRIVGRVLGLRPSDTGARVRLVEDDGQASWQVTVGPGGDYEFAELAPGRYRLGVRMAGLVTSVDSSIEVRSGRDARLDFTVPSGVLTLALSWVDGSRLAPKASVQLRRAESDLVVATGSVGADGAVPFRGVSAGTYRVTVSVQPKITTEMLAEFMEEREQNPDARLPTARRGRSSIFMIEGADEETASIVVAEQRR